MNVRVGVLDADRRRHHAVLNAVQRLDQARHAGSRFKMPHVALDRADQQRMMRAPALADGHAQRVRFDRVTDCGTGAVGFDVINIVGIDLGACIDFFKQGALRGRARHGQARFAAIGVNGGIGDDGQDVIAVGHCRIVVFQEKNAAAFGAHVAVAVGIEHIAATAFGQHRRFGKTDKAIRMRMQTHATRQRLYGLAGENRLARLVKCHQRR